MSPSSLYRQWTGLCSQDTTQRTCCDISLLEEAGSEFVTGILVICRKEIKSLGKGVDSPCALSSTGRLKASLWPYCGIRFGVPPGKAICKGFMGQLSRHFAGSESGACVGVSDLENFELVFLGI